MEASPGEPGSLRSKDDRMDELTPAQKLQAAVITAGQRIPGGFQVGIPLHLDAAIKEIDELFVEHDLPLREELIAELVLWREHAREAEKYNSRCTELMDAVINTVGRR